MMKRFFTAAACLAMMAGATAQTDNNFEMRVKLTDGTTQIFKVAQVDKVTFAHEGEEDPSEAVNILDEAHIPNATILNWVKNNLADGGDVYTDQQAAAYTGEINLPWYGLYDIKGLENFPNITSLNLSGNSRLETLDLSVFSKLQRLDCGWCSQVAELTLNEQAPLQYINISGTKLYKYDLSDYTNTLTKIEIAQLNYSDGDIDFHDFAKLDTIKAGTNDFRSLDLSGMSNLVMVDVYSNNLTAVNLTGCTGLKELNVSSCNIASIDIADCPILEQLYVQNNPQLTTVDLSQLRATLTVFNGSKTAISQIDFDGFSLLKTIELQDTPITEAPDLSECTALEKIRLENTNITSVDLNHCKNLVELQCYNTKLESLTLSDMPQLQTVQLNNNPNLTSIDIQNAPNCSFSATNCNLQKRLDLSRGLATSGWYALRGNPNLKEIKVWPEFGEGEYDIYMISKDDTAEIVYEFTAASE